MLIVVDTFYAKNLTMKDVPPGHWCAINPNEPDEIISHGVNLESVVKVATDCGIRPLVHKVLDHLTVNEKYKEKYIKGLKNEN